ncbi:MAG: hypothetical protein FJY44_11210 [Betaproteobacteria bacterium]|nr:hypothetical protein [Betaproteobacteria bacterium]
MDRDAGHPKLGSAFLEGWRGLEEALPKAALAHVEPCDEIAEEAAANLEARGLGDGLKPIQQRLGRSDAGVEQGVFKSGSEVVGIVRGHGVGVLAICWIHPA